uniref:Uncharacterized protein n=1 Tax=Aegilops tauschii subsp. strangulata TaxID=200361 RepID=A0A453FE75_AEGTS
LDASSWQQKGRRGRHDSRSAPLLCISKYHNPKRLSHRTTLCNPFPTPLPHFKFKPRRLGCH